MSREVTGTGPDDEPRPSPLSALIASLTASLTASPRGRLLAGAGALTAAVVVAVVALQSGAAEPTAPDAGPSTAAAATPSDSPSSLPARPPTADGLTAALVPAGRDGADLTSLDVRVAVDNARDAPVTVAGVQVVGLGTTIVELRDAVVVPAGDRLYLRARVTPDCAARERGALRVVVTRAGADGARVAEQVTVPDVAGALAVLEPLCPPVERGLAVRVVATVRTEGGTAVRIVNHGTRSALVTPRAGPDAGPARLVSDPPLPYDLAPGEALVARLRVVSDCRPADPAAAAEALFLEAETPDGFTAVTGFPTAAVRGDLEALGTAARCPASP